MHVCCRLGQHRISDSNVELFRTLYKGNTWLELINDVVEAHCYAVDNERIDLEHECSKIDNKLIAGCFGPAGLINCIQNKADL